MLLEMMMSVLQEVEGLTIYFIILPAKSLCIYMYVSEHTCTL